MNTPVADRWPGLRRFGSVLLLGLGSIAVAAAALGWCLRMTVSDTVPSLQKFAWIPTPLLLAAALAGVGLLCGSRAIARSRAALVGLLVGALLLLAMSTEHLGSRWGAAKTCADPIRIVHWNATSPSPEDSEPQRAELAGLPWDVLIVSNDATLFGRWFAHRWRDGPGGEERTVRRAGPFALVTDHPVLESRLAIASGGIWLGVFRIELPVGPGRRGGRELVVHVLDLPSDPDLPRGPLLTDLRRRLDELQLPEPDLVMGDLNLDAGSGALAAAYPGLVPAFEVAGEGYAASYPRRWPLWQTDQTLVERDLAVCRYRLVDLGFGTHRAQELSIERADEPQPTGGGSS